MCLAHQSRYIFIAKVPEYMRVTSNGARRCRRWQPERAGRVGVTPTPAGATCGLDLVSAMSPAGALLSRVDVNAGATLRWISTRKTLGCFPHQTVRVRYRDVRLLYFVDGEAGAAKSLADAKARAPAIPFGIRSSVDLRFPCGGAVWCRGGGDQ